MEIRRKQTLRFGIVFCDCPIRTSYRSPILIIQNVDTQKWQEIAKDLRSNTTEIWAKRGNICADDGSILSTSVPYYEIRMDLMAPRIQEILHGNRKIWLENFLTSSVFKDEFRRRVATGAYAKKNRWFLVNPEQMDHNKFQEFKLLKPCRKVISGSGIIVVTENRRILPHGDLASRTIGVLNKGAFGGVQWNVGYTRVEGVWPKAIWLVA